MKEIKIPISNKKMIFLILGALAFVLIGIWFVTNPESLSTRTRNRNPYLTQIVGIVSMVFFGLCFIFMIIKLLDKKFKGIIINEKGIDDNSSGISVGLVEWKDIKGFRAIEIQKNKSLMIITKNPEKYISKATNKISKKFMEWNWKGFGSPLAISVTSLKIKFDELEKILNEYFECYKSK